MAALEARMSKLEVRQKDHIKVTDMMQRTLGSIEAWCTKVYYLKGGSPLETDLQQAHNSWKVKRVLGTEHPDGPPRRGMFYIMVTKTILPGLQAVVVPAAGDAAPSAVPPICIAGLQFQLEEGRLLMQSITSISSPKALEQVGQHVEVIKCKDGGSILKLRIGMEHQQTWRMGMAVLEAKIQEQGGESRPDDAPKGKLLKDLTKYAYSGGKKGGGGSLEVDA